MRLLVLVPDLVQGGPLRKLTEFIGRHNRLERLAIDRRLLVHPRLYTHVAWGGTLNNMRHAALARSLGVDARLVSPSGKDTYGSFNVVKLPYMRWSDRRDDDVVLVPDFCTELANDVRGKAIVYLQVPIHLKANFDYLDPRMILWTDSPHMLALCQKAYPGKDIPIVPNIVDSGRFPFRPQSEREPGLIFAFPRKGPDFIQATRDHYAKLGGKFWHFELIDGIPLDELAQRMQRAQAFLASADVEGCALPPQESMACGMVVVGKSATGANFSMQHRKTAMVAETPEVAAQCLRELEDATLRDQISRNAHEFISRYFPTGEPRRFWRRTLLELGFELPAEREPAADAVAQ
ncbi:MAG: glycosyltransferase [Nannocystaceae bacterium]|nr:glycosyltransferase [Nannocystaceae bacterium]